MTNPLFKKFIPVIVLFVLINILILACKHFLSREGVAINFIAIANVILFLLTSFGFYMQTKGVNSSNVNAFIRGIYSAILMKMFVIAGAIFIYIYASGGRVNTAAIFTSMAIYLMYTFIEVVQLMKIARRKPNA